VRSDPTEGTATGGVVGEGRAGFASERIVGEGSNESPAFVGGSKDVTVEVGEGKDVGGRTADGEEGATGELLVALDDVVVLIEQETIKIVTNLKGEPSSKSKKKEDAPSNATHE